MLKLDCSVHVETLTQITKEQAEYLINATNKKQGWPVSVIDPRVENCEVEISYPLTNPDFLLIVEENTIGGLLWEISKRYKEIYRGENKTCKTRIESNPNSSLLNRRATDGNYGIYGHELRDLWYEGIEIDNGKIKLHIGS